MKKLFLLGAVAALLLSCGKPKVFLTRYVNPFIGTAGHGHVFLGANVPFGMVQLGPTQNNRTWDWCSGYHYSDSLLLGFSHMHLSGTGCGDLGDICFRPFLDNPQALLRFDHQDEVAHPGYYAVTLRESGIKAELTATARTGVHRYTFPTENGKMAIDLSVGLGWDKTTEAKLTQESDRIVNGYRFSSGWANAQKVYFTIQFEHPITLTSDSIVCFSRKENVVKVGLSTQSIEGAKTNLAAENPSWDFDEVAHRATMAWERQLAKINIATDDEKQKTVFYTALYHTMIAPSVYGDVDAGFTEYTTFSLWDTYRAAHPLYTIVQPEMQADLASTFIDLYRKEGHLPIWHLMGCETNCMVGSSGVPVLGDMILKGFVADKEAAYEAMRGSMMLDNRSLGLLKKYGYIPYDKEPAGETVAKGLEYAIDDDAVAKVAAVLKKDSDVVYFGKRSKSYQHYFDPETKFMRAVSADGKFRPNFVPTSNNKNLDYTEGTAWQYLWLVPHDVKGLVSLLGGEEAFVQKLDSLFVADSNLGADAVPDITGLIGQYAHGNEPGHHTPYLYMYTKQPWKTAQLVRQIMTTLYDDTPAGLCGNEDVGQMSAWYVLSALGFYQVEPAGGRFVFGSPLFPQATINVGNGHTLTVIAHNNSAENMYVQSVRLNGTPYNENAICFDDIQKGGTLEFTMGPTPSATFGVN
ncbi:MAG: GH92 family glycosyl hydrolase [Bacteroidales bacterium]|nr:GH92 family glycosyl hydrolase [Bacteroidales bacterium]